jgi:hypothetical protein
VVRAAFDLVDHVLWLFIAIVIVQACCRGSRPTGRSRDLLNALTFPLLRPDPQGHAADRRHARPLAARVIVIAQILLMLLASAEAQVTGAFLCE